MRPAATLRRAFRRFESARILRTARVQLESRALWDFYHAEGIARDVRNETDRRLGRGAYVPLPRLAL